MQTTYNIHPKTTAKKNNGYQNLEPMLMKQHNIIILILIFIFCIFRKLFFKNFQICAHIKTSKKTKNCKLTNKQANTHTHTKWNEMKKKNLYSLGGLDGVKPLFVCLFVFLLGFYVYNTCILYFFLNKTQTYIFVCFWMITLVLFIIVYFFLCHNCCANEC